MHRSNADPENMRPEDFLCDFCERAWSEGMAMVEGHRGALICGRCLSVAYSEVGRTEDAGAGGEGGTCVMCLEAKEGPLWRSAVDEGKAICRRCVRQSAGMLEKDGESGWTRPV